MLSILLYTFLFAAGTNETKQPNEGLLLKGGVVAAAFSQDNSSKVFSSAWEKVPVWSSQKDPQSTSFSFSKSIPQLNKDVSEKGVVFVFARNLWPEEVAFKDMGSPEKPLAMPFYFLPYFEKPDYTEQWNFTASDSKIDISLVVKGTEEAAVPGKNIQLRYIVIPESALKFKKKTADVVRKMSYQQLLETFGLPS